MATRTSMSYSPIADRVVHRLCGNTMQFDPETVDPDTIPCVCGQWNPGDWRIIFTQEVLIIVDDEVATNVARNGTD